jgi:hypothetical protein
MRGSTEELMLVRHTSATDEEIAKAVEEAIDEAAVQGVPHRVVWEESSSLAEATEKWRQAVKKTDYVDTLHSWESQLLFARAPNSGRQFEDFLYLATTVDGSRNWAVEEDMQLSELLAKTAVKEGVQPQNLHVESLRKALSSIESNSSALIGLEVDRMIARAAILRVANRVIGIALPYLNTTVPEELWRTQTTGLTTDIDIIPTVLPWNGSLKLPHSTNLSEIQITASGLRMEHEKPGSSFNWTPPCLARRLRSFRRLLFNQTKIEYWESVLEATTTPTPLHQDEYEDPREIQTVSVNRVKAVHSRLATITNTAERVKQTVFGQMKDSMRKWSDHYYRRSYLGKGHGGQKRAFKVKFLGEGVNDYGGPYRAVFEQVCEFTELRHLASELL